MILAQQSLPHTRWEFFGFVLLLLASNLSAIMAWVTSLRNNKLGKVNADQIDRNTKKLEEVGDQVNGKIEHLLVVSRAADMAEGRQMERDLQATNLITSEEKAKALVALAAEVARELAKSAQPIPPPEPPGEIGVRKVRES